MRLKMLPKKGHLHDLNNWRGIILLDGAFKLVSTINAYRLGRLFKEKGLEAQNGFTGGRGARTGPSAYDRPQPTAGARARLVGADVGAVRGSGQVLRLSAVRRALGGAR